MGTRNTDPRAIRRARRLRGEMSDTERRLWWALRAHRMGFHVRRQHPVGPYCLDFFVDEAKLCIEVDGEQHTYRERERRDARRDEYLSGLGIMTLRVPSPEVHRNLKAVLATIHRVCCERSGRTPY